MATTYTITRLNAASYDFTIGLDAAFAETTTIRWEIVPVAGKFPSATWTGTVDFSTSEDSKSVSPPITRNHIFPRDFEIRLYRVVGQDDSASDETDDEFLFTSEAQSIAGDSTLAGAERLDRGGGNDKNIIGLGASETLIADGRREDDAYIITRYQYGNVEISDDFGDANLIKFDYGVTITAVSESASFGFDNDINYRSITLTLSTGADVLIDAPAGRFRYQLGEDKAILNYLEFKMAIGVVHNTDNPAIPPVASLPNEHSITTLTSVPELPTNRVEVDVSLIDVGGGNREDIISAATDYILNLDALRSNDIYVITRFQHGNVEISDDFGDENLIKFDSGVTITAVSESASFGFNDDINYRSITLTLSTGADVLIDAPAGRFRYQLGDGEVLNYLDFKAAIGVVHDSSDSTAPPVASLPDGADYTVPDLAPFDITGDALRRDVDENIGDVALFTFKAVLKSDANADVSYSITEGNGDGLFALVVEDGSDNAVISLAPNKNLDYETATSHKLTVQLSASGETQNVTITMNVKDINDEVPVLSVDTSGAVPIAENDPGADTGIVFSVVDKDSVGTLTYDVAATTRNADNDEIAALFEVDVATGMLRLRERMALDREHDALKTSGQISLTITANDGRDTIGDSNFEAVTITITDENDNAPMLGAPVWEGSFDAGVREDTATDTKIFGITATDDDADPTLTYKIVSINGTLLADITNPLFRIEPDNGDVKIANALDYETAPQTYSIVIQASDGKHQSNTAAVIVTVTDANDNAPQYVDVDGTALTTTATINERIAGNTDPIDVLTFKFTDEDTAGVNPAIMARYFTVLDSNDVEDARFAVVADGQNWKLQLKATAELDFDTTKTLDLRISMNDQTHIARSDLITLNVVNVDEDEATYRITGTFAAGETLTATRIAEDPDGIAVAASFQWFTTTDGGTNKNNAPGTSNLQTYTLPSTLADGVVYGVTITYTDAVIGALPTVINVLTSSLSFADSTPTVNVPENLGAGGAVTTLTASLDGAPGATVNYDFAPNGNPDNLFAISGSGAITLIASNSLDFDTDPKSYKIIITASAKDNKGEIHTATAVVTVNLTDTNDIAPILSVDTSGAVAIVENDAGADTGIVFSVVDTDSVGTLGYSVAAATRNADNDAIAALFEVDVATGMLRLRERMALDREHAALKTSGEIELTITANDGAADSNAETVTISVTDTNDNTPKSTPPASKYALYVLEIADIGNTILAAGSIIDADATAPFNTLKYELMGSYGSYFNLDEATGKITLNQNLDFETLEAEYKTSTDAKGFDLTLKATDNPDATDPAKQNDVEQGLTITLVDVNETALNVTLSAISAAQDEDYTGTLGATITVAGTARYEDGDFIVLGADGLADDRFDVVWDAAAQRGVLWVTRAVDYDALNPPLNPLMNLAPVPVALTIMVIDGDVKSGQTVNVGTADFTYTVGNIDDEAPILSKAQGTGSIVEQQNGLDTGITFTLSDPDTPISTTPTADTTDIDPNSFRITAAGGYEQRYANVFQVVWDDTADNWKLKLRERSYINYEDPDVDDDKLLHFDIHVTDGMRSSFVRRVDVEVVNADSEPMLGPPHVEGARNHDGRITENELGADTGVSFEAWFDLKGVRTAVEASNFVIAPRSGVHQSYPDLFEFVRRDDTDWWELKLKDEFSINREGAGIPNYVLRLAVRLADNAGNITQEYHVHIHLDDEEGEVTPTLNTHLRYNVGSVVEDIAGADTGLFFTVTDGDTPISTTGITSGDSTDIDPDSFNITPLDGTHAKFARMLWAVRDEGSDTWRIKLRDGVSLDYDDAALPAAEEIELDAGGVDMFKRLHFSVNVSDDDGNTSTTWYFHVDVRAATPILAAPNKHTARIAENDNSAESGITFTLVDADTPISTTGRTTAITDIDPDSFTIATRNDTNDKFAKLFEVVRDGTTNTWKLKLKEDAFLNYEDRLLDADKILQFAIHVTDPEDNDSAIHNIDIVVEDVDHADQPPDVRDLEGTGSIRENSAGADSGVSFYADSPTSGISAFPTNLPFVLDPTDFVITTRDGTNEKFAGLFAIARHFSGGDSMWALRLQPGKSLDYEDPVLLDADKKLHLSVQITDHRGNESPILNIDVTVIDVNEAPVWEAGDVIWDTAGTAVTGDDNARTLVEGMEVAGTALASFTATDADAGDDDATLIYSIMGGSPTNNAGAAIFEFDGNVLKLKTALDFEASSIMDLGNDLRGYTLMIVAADDESATSAPQPITIYVEGVDDNDPMLGSPAITWESAYDGGDDETANIMENAYIDTRVHIGTFMAVDADIGVGGNLSYELTGDDDIFELDENNFIYLKAPLDYESETALSFTITVRDDDDAPPVSHSVNVVVGNVDDVKPDLPPPNKSTGSITEKDLGADTGITFTLTDVDTPISYTNTADTTDIDPESFKITATGGYAQKFAEVFEVVWDAAANNWKLTLKPGATIDYEDMELDDDDLLHFDIHVVDGGGNTSDVHSVNIEVVNIFEGPYHVPVAAGLVHGTSELMENQLGADTGIAFDYDDAAVPISYVVTDDPNDIDPSNFRITPLQGFGHRFVATRYEIVGDGDGNGNNWFKLKLKDGYSADYEGFGLNDSKRIGFEISLKNADGSNFFRADGSRAFHHSYFQLLNEEPEVVPTLFVVRKAGIAKELNSGINTLAAFSLSDPDTAISTTNTPAVTTDIEPSRFIITTRDGTDDKYLKMLDVVWDTAHNRWTVKLKPEMQFDYDDTDLPDEEYVAEIGKNAKVLLIAVHVTDPDGNVSSKQDLEIRVLDAVAPDLGIPQGTGRVIENVLGADAGITFTLTDADTPISTTGRTPGDDTDIDPDDFDITAQSGTNAYFAGLFEVARAGITNNWQLKLKPNAMIDYEDMRLPTDKTIGLTIQVTDPENLMSMTRDVSVKVLATPDLSTPQGTGRITENQLGMDTGITFTLTDADTSISTTGRTTAITDIDPDSFTITATGGYDQKFADVFDVVWDATNSNWKLTLQDGATIDYEDIELDNDKLLHFDIYVTDPDGGKSAVRRVDVEVRNDPDGPHLALPMGAGEIIENAIGADSGITFAASDEDAQGNTINIAVSDFDIKTRDGTHTKFAGMFTFAQIGDTRIWKLKLKPGMSLDHEDTNLPADKTIHLSVQVSTSSGDTSAKRNVDITVRDDTTAPTLGEAQGAGIIVENIAGADSGISFEVSDGMTTISPTETTATNDIDPNSFTITERAGTNAKFARMFILAYDETEDVWRLKLKERMALDYDDTALPANDKTIRLTIQITDPEGMASTTPREVEISVLNNETPNLGAPQGTGLITENAIGADSGITFTLTDPDTPISYTATDAITTDIDPNSFDISARDGTHADFAGMFTFAQGGTANTWKLKLKPGVSLDYEDPNMPDDDILRFTVGVTDPDDNASLSWDIDVEVENVDEIAPSLTSSTYFLYVMENDLGEVLENSAGNIVAITITDEITPGVSGAIDSSNLHLTTAGGARRPYVEYFELVRVGTSDVWNLKLKDEFSLDYEDPYLLTGRGKRFVWLHLKIIDDAGNESVRETFEISVLDRDPETTPTLNAPLGNNVGVITENVRTAYTELRFTVTDDDTPSSTTGRTADVTDIDPDSFTITAQDGTDAKFAGMFEVEREGTSDSWRIKLKNGAFLNYEDPDMPAPEDSGNKRLDLAVKVSDNNDNTSTTWYFHIDVRDAIEASPVLTAKLPIAATTGLIIENQQGVDSGINFSLTDSDSLFATTGRTTATNDIDPDSFTITGTDGTDQDFADMFEVVNDPTLPLFVLSSHEKWKLKLRDGVSLDYEDRNLPDDDILHFDIQVTDPEGNKSAVQSVNIEVRDDTSDNPAPAPPPAPAPAPAPDIPEDLGLTPIPETDPNA